MSKEHDEWVARHLGIDPASYEATEPDPDQFGGVSQSAHSGAMGLDLSTDPTAGQPAGTSPPVSTSPAPFKQPPEGVLRRAGDGEIFWQPNATLQTIG